MVKHSDAKKGALRRKEGDGNGSTKEDELGKGQGKMVGQNEWMGVTQVI